jgi:nitroreductase
MELIEVMKHRRAVRNYTDAPVERPLIGRLIEAAILAPSAMNLQPWAFAVYLDRAHIGEYGKRSKSWSVENFSRTSFTPDLRRMLEDPEFTMFYHAPALVIVLAKTPDAQAAEDCCLAAENLMLAARDEGLGTCWIGLARPWLDLPSTKAEMGLPEHFHVVAPLVVGYPKAWPEFHGRSPAEVHWLE